jgi:hypothetical protein
VIDKQWNYKEYMMHVIGPLVTYRMVIMFGHNFKMNASRALTTNSNLSNMVLTPYNE